MPIVLTVLTVFLILIANEYWFRLRRPNDELSRKLVHITVGSYVAFWPFYLSWNQIVFLSASFFVVVLISKYLKLFQAIHSVQRPTWGELFFALAVGIIALASNDEWVYAASLLVMSLADGLAAVLGSSYGKKFRYTILGHPKSLLGTASFFIITFLILTTVNPHLIDQVSIFWIFGITLLATFMENIGVAGLDNLAVPLIVTALLTNA